VLHYAAFFLYDIHNLHLTKQGNFRKSKEVKIYFKKNPNQTKTVNLLIVLSLTRMSVTIEYGERGATRSVFVHYHKQHLGLLLTTKVTNINKLLRYEITLECSCK
jgi:hypothetical protein